MTSVHADKQVMCTLVLLVACAGPVAGAEVRGAVSVEYQGLFQRGNVSGSYPVSVALLPAAGQRTARTTAARHRVEIVGNRMRPAFLTVQKGDSIEFVNRDDVYHELFSLSAGKPVNTRLGKAGDHDRESAVFTLEQPGTNHFFCRIHNKGYARIDVVDTPYIQIVKPGGKFSFGGLQPGPWRLRLAAPAAETAWVDVTAVTSPPPLQLTLKSHSGGVGRSGGDESAAIDRLYRPVPGKGPAK